MKLPKGKLRVPPSQRPGHIPRQSWNENAIDQNDIRFIATHEAGHAVAAVVLGLDLRGVDIRRRSLPDGRVSLGFTDCPVPARGTIGVGPEAIMPYLIQASAGPLAESRINPSAMGSGAFSEDVAGARRIALMALCMPDLSDAGKIVIAPAEQARHVDAAKALAVDSVAHANRFVAGHWPAIEAVAEALLARRSLSGGEVRGIVEKVTVPDSD